MSTDKEFDGQAERVLEAFGLGEIFESTEEIETHLALFFNDNLVANQQMGTVTSKEDHYLASGMFFTAISALLGPNAALRIHERADLLRGQEAEAQKGQLN